MENQEVLENDKWNFSTTRDRYKGDNAKEERCNKFLEDCMDEENRLKDIEELKKRLESED